MVLGRHGIDINVCLPKKKKFDLRVAGLNFNVREGKIITEVVQDPSSTCHTWRASVRKTATLFVPPEVDRNSLCYLHCVRTGYSGVQGLSKA